MKITESLKSLILLPVLVIGMPVVLISRFFESKIERTPEEVESVLFEMASGKVSDDCWDDFLSIPIKNKSLDRIRERVEVLWAYEEYQRKNNKGFYVLNVKGLSEIQGIIRDLQAIRST
ncbi:hypothetical protein N7931_13100 [Catenovulum sp. 2E275]|uniref:hypothetical protein n=1 Tax=Catenovulum sp. 2E275 TaxID=2980497 RepID=UPI0021CE132F|nr:hypothetical protein [Catenovulum sp. 2E275]MCU4676568.1 hypothetical protein [Catenovulum sp. 2E275]